ncbi:zincin-like metallopeptidase domain-containing protein [Aggregatibacter actinomycetemcomitans]|uniref:zincin-like metallopeptidase domain-containing protein n=1 Tax=Aggregatibacter actinomycetemcomitans TaxID=714 RepID=UPI001E586638|nr:zincin-like metallopeptidase domain-containing protein [Aggregatibacter actinomycetemcomitans]
MSEQEKKSISFEDLYGMQSEAFYDLIMQSDQSWRKSWASDGFEQQNATTEKPYNNLNQTLLFKRAVTESLADPRWITFTQAKEANYKIKKGVKGSQIFRLVRGYDRLVKDENGNLIQDENGKNKMEHITYDRPRIKIFTVFNARDVEGIEPFKKSEIPEQHRLLMQQENYKNAEIMVKAFCEKNDISLQEMASESAFHAHNNGATIKKVVVPLKSQFDNLDNYFSVLFHEVAHSTKHLGIRVNKNTDTETGNNFGSTNYAKEELTAELTALLLCKQFKINSTETAQREDNSIAYLGAWIESGILTKEDFKIATIEANRASKAIFEHAPEIKLTLDDIKQEQKKLSEPISKTEKLTDTTGHNQVAVDNVDSFTKAINTLYQKGNAGISTLNDLAKGKERNILPLTEEEIENGIKNGYLKITHQSRVPTYAITGTGGTIINNAKERALAIEAEKTGKKVSKKEINEMYDSIHSTHRVHFSGSTNTEFRDSQFPNYIIPKIEEAQKLLERPLNEHSLPYKEMLENAIKNSELMLNKWDKLQENRLTTSQGEDITNIKLLWSEANTDQNIHFGTDLNKLQNWFTKTYKDTTDQFNPLNPNQNGYDKNDFEITYREQGQSENKTVSFRIDVGKGRADFNPLTENVKQYIEKILDREFIAQSPKLSSEIKKEREETNKLSQSQQGIKM